MQKVVVRHSVRRELHVVSPGNHGTMTRIICKRRQATDYIKDRCRAGLQSYRCRQCAWMPGMRRWVLIMHTTFAPRILLCLIVVFVLLSRSAVGTQTVAQGMSALPANEPFSLSYAAGGYDARGNFLGGTELMNLAAFEGKLYAGIGYWTDRPQLFSAPADPKSGPQILVLDSKNARWRQEMAFNERDDTGAFKYTRIGAMQVIQFHRFDTAGNVVGPRAEMLVVGLDGKDGTVYTQRSPGNWEDTLLPTSIPLRSLVVHYDPADRTEKLYAGPGGGQTKNIHRAIYSGVYDPLAPGRIRWDPTPERIVLQDRVVSMVDCGGTLFAAIKPSIFRRNDQTKTWELFYSYPITNPFDLSGHGSGFRGLTCINGPDGKKALLSGFDGFSGDILRIDLDTGAAVVELNTRQFLTQQWGSPPTEQDIIAGYNDIPLVESGPDERRLFGLLALSPNANETNSAWILSGTTNYPPRYELHEVGAPLKWPYNRSDAALWSVRTIAVSPFPEDQGQVLYLGGYDGHFKPNHNTAWLYRAGVNTTLARFKDVSR